MVDVSNFNGKAWIAANGIPVSQNAHLTEWYRLIEDGVTALRRYPVIVNVTKTLNISLRAVWRKYFFNLRNKEFVGISCAEGNRR